MRLFSFLYVLALLCGFVASAAVAVGSSVSERADRNLTGGAPARGWKKIAIPKLPQRPTGLLDKREEQYVFGGFKTSEGSCKDQYCPLVAPIIDGRPKPYCNTFPESNGYTMGENPAMEFAHLDPIKKYSDFPQVVCFFYNDFYCDPTKGKAHLPRQAILYDDKMWLGMGMKGPGEDIDFLLTDGARKTRHYYFKAYGCMLYEDAPSVVPGDEEGMSLADMQAWVAAQGAEGGLVEP